MAEFSSHSAGTPAWVDLVSPDLGGAKDFYGQLFGWELEDQFDPAGNHAYTMARVNGKAVVGMRPKPPASEMPSFWNTYIATDDLDATAQSVEANGGQVITAPREVMGSGKMAVFADPTGAIFSGWQAQDHIGTELGNIANTYSWNELMTRDLPSSQAFYSSLFGWHYNAEEMPSGDYNIIEGEDSARLAGMLEMPSDVPEDVPNHWGVYFTVDDLEASVEKVTNLGGTIAMPPMELLGGRRVSTLIDSWGASFIMMGSS